MKKLLLILMVLTFCPGFILSGQAQGNSSYAQDVFDRIVKAVNRDFPSPPTLEIVNNSNMVAVTSSDGVVKVSTKLIELMRGFGADSANALAHVLAHEVMHYYNEHFWAGNFAMPYADAGWGQELQMIDSDTLQMQYQETQADLYGLFYATNAGFQTTAIADAVIDSIYRWFELPFKMQHYPDLDARKEMARSAAEEVMALIPAYEAGITLLHLSASAEGNEQLTYLKGASAFFAHITDSYIRTREMLNNIGVVKVMEALRHMNDTISALQWPLYIETGSVLYSAAGSRGSSIAIPEKAERLLMEARKYFEEALELERGYQPATINLCIVYALMGKSGSFTDTFDELVDQPEWLGLELQGLAAFIKGDQKEAVSLLKKAIAQGSGSGDLNLAIVKGDMMAASIEIPPLQEITTQVDSLPIAEFFASLMVDRSNRTDTKNGDCLLFVDTIGNWQVMEIKFRFPEKAFRTLKFVRLLPGTSQETAEGLQMDDTMKQLLKIYGERYQTSRENEHQVLLFPQQYFICWLSTSLQVDSWAYWWAK